MGEKLSADGKRIKVKEGNITYTRPKIGGHMHKYLPENQIGAFKIKRKVADDKEVKRLKMRAVFSFSYGEYYDFEPGIYTTLSDNMDVIMSDTPMEIRTNDEFIQKAEGDILIGGLGLGMILLAIQDNAKVKSIIIIEKYNEILKLVAKHLPLNKKVKIIKGDIFEWQPEKSTKFDTIYFDIWNNTCSDNYLQMKELHKRFRKFLNKTNPNYWMSSWKYRWAKREHHADNKRWR